jgi:outer membrane protein
VIFVCVFSCLYQPVHSPKIEDSDVLQAERRRSLRVAMIGNEQGVLDSMKRISVVVAVLASGFALSAAAQTATSAPAAAAAPAGPPKVAVIEFQAAVTSTNEFQRDFGDLQKKFEPQRTQLKTLSDEVDTLTKQLQSQSATLSDAERASKAKTLDDKKKQAQRIAEDAQNDYQQAMQETFGKVAGKVDELLNTYAKDQGYTLVIDATEQQQQAPTVLYAAPSSNITKAIVDAYNVKSGVPAPPPQAPAPAPHAAAPKGPAGR